MTLPFRKMKRTVVPIHTRHTSTLGQGARHGLQEILQPEIPSIIRSCNLVIGAVLAWVQFCSVHRIRINCRALPFSQDLVLLRSYCVLMPSPLIIFSTLTNATHKEHPMKQPLTLSVSEDGVFWKRGLAREGRAICQARKKEHKPKLLSPDIFRWGWGLPHEGVGAKKFGMSLETREIKLLLRDISGYLGILLGYHIFGVPEKFEKKKVCLQILGPNLGKSRIHRAQRIPRDWEYGKTKGDP